MCVAAGLGECVHTCRGSLEGKSKRMKEVSSRLMFIRIKTGMDEYVIVGAYRLGQKG